MDSENIKIAALGQPFTLGMFYDARKDELIPGYTLWDEKTLQEKTVERVQPSSTFNITASESFDSKSSLLDINASMKASFMGGLIQVEGSAKYLNDNKKSHNQSRVTCQYKATTNFKQLSLTNPTVDDKQKEFIKQGSATHVVTGILYGASGVFVFDSEKVESSNDQGMSGSMKAVIKKIPSLSIAGEIGIKLTDKEQKLTKNFSCTFYGDFVLKRNPATFKEAVKTYTELPTLLGEKGENTVPVVVWLMPLTHFHPEAAGLKGEISNPILRKAQDVLEDLREIEMRCNDSLEDTVVGNFPDIRHQLKRFQEYCNYHESDLKKTLAVELPLLRAGKKEDENSVKKFCVDTDKSPFSHDKLSEWMDHKEREINVIRSCVDTMQGMKCVKFVQNQSQLDREVLAPGVEDALCFVFTSLGGDDPYLDEMAKYLDSSEDSVQVESPDEDQWYYSAEVVTKVREKAKVFQDLAKAQMNNKQFPYLVAALPNDKYKGATIYQYKNGNLVTEEPDPPAVTDRRDLIRYACDLTLDPDTAHNWLHLSEGNKKATCGDPQPELPDNLERFDTHPQVLCKEGLKGQHYWEVEMSDNGKEWVYIAVAYKGVERKGDTSKFGQDKMSWSFGKSSPEKEWYACHNGDTVKNNLPSTGFTRVGVFLDWPAGTLSFYSVSSNTLTHFYTFRTEFTEPLYPGLFVFTVGCYALLNPGLAQNGALGGQNVGELFQGHISVQQTHNKIVVSKRGRGAGKGEPR